MSKLLSSIKGDKVIWIVILILSIFSILAVYSSTGTLAFKKQGGNTEFYLFKHFGILLFGFFLMYLAHLVKYTYYSRISQLTVYLIAIPLLLITLFSGTNINQASRWITLPIIDLNFQTSDLAKLALIMYIARFLTIKQTVIKDFKSAFVPVMLPILITCGLILPANFSTAAMLFVTCLILLFIGRINIKYILSLLAIGVVSLTIFITILYQLPEENRGRLGTWTKRVDSFINGDSENNFQVDQAKIAIANGGILGVKPGNSTQKNFLPQPYSDFIYAIIIEEYGLIGGFILILLYLILFFRGIKIAAKSSKNFGALLTIGICFSLVFQAMINMAVAVNILPVTGQTLPMVSMGGTSIWFTSIGVGVILSVSKEATKEEDDENVEKAEHADRQKIVNDLNDETE